MKNIDKRNFRSSSFPLAAFLFAKGEVVAGINETDNPSKKEFTFLATPRLEELVNAYKWDRDNPELLVSAHQYEQARRELLDRLNS